MKKPVLSLLLAGASAMKGKKMPKMSSKTFMDEYMKPGPMWMGDEKESCEDATVTAAKTALSTAQGEVDKFKGLSTTLVAQVDAAVVLKKAAVQAVIAADLLVKTKVEANRDADLAQLTAQDDKDTKEAAKVAAAAALAALNSQKTTVDALLVSLGTQKADATAAKTQAALYVTSEGLKKTAAGVIIAANTSVATQSTYDAAVAAKPALVSDSDTKKGLRDAAQTSLTSLGLEKTDATAQALADTNALATKLTAKNAAAAAFGSTQTDLETAAGLVATTYLTYLQKLSDIYFKDSAFTSGQERTTKADLYTSSATGNACDATKGTASAAIGASNTDVKCQASCDAIPFSNLYTAARVSESKTKLGSQTLNAAAENANMDTADKAMAGACMGYAFTTGTNVCKTFAYIAGKYALATGSAETDTTCNVRKQANLGYLAHASFLLYKAEADKVRTTSTYTVQAALVNTFTDNAGGSAWLTANREHVTYTDRVTQTAAVKLAAETAYNAQNTILTTKTNEYNTAAGLVTAKDTDIATKKGLWDTAKTELTTATADQTTATSLVEDWGDTVTFATALETSVQAQIDAQTTIQGGLVTSIAAAVTANTAAETAFTTAETALTTATTAATTAEAAVASYQPTTRAPLETAVTSAETAVAAVWTKVTTNTASLDAAVLDLAVKQTAFNNAEVACQAAQFDAFKTSLLQAEATRKADLTTIKDLIAADAKPALGATKGRCEKPMTNGDWARRGKCSLETDCCGAAKGVGPSGATMTIEVCQAKTDKSYMYRPPRAPMATTWPTVVSWDFACIGGAAQIAGAATALLTSAYMMA